MNTYKVFVASSIVEFSTQRARIVYFFNRLSRALGTVRFDVFVCEQATKSLAMGRKQDEFNDAIAGRDLFLMLAGARVGEYTLEELKVAANIQEREGKPAILVICDDYAPMHQLSEITGDAAARIVSAELDNAPALLNTILQWLTKELSLDVSVTSRGVCVNGRRVIAKRYDSAKDG